MSHRYQGCIYSTRPNDPHYQLSRDELASIDSQLKGLPVRVEHCDKSIGKILRSWIDESGRSFVEWEMDDDVRGWGASKLINVGAVAQLSLKHEVYPDGTVRAIEVSICEQGARPDTDITARVDASSGVVEPFAAATKYITPGQPVLVAASSREMDQELVAKAAAIVAEAMQKQSDTAAAAAAAETAAPAPVAQVAHTEPESNKRPRESDDNETRRKKVQTDAERLMKSAELAAATMEPADADALISSLRDVIGNQVNSEKVIGVTQVQLAEMLAKANEQKTTHKDLAKDIVEGIVTLWGELTPDRTVTASDRQFMQDVYESNPRFAILSQPMVIAASSLAKRGVERKATDLEIKLAETRSLVGMMSSQLNAFGNMGADPAPPTAPRWVEPAAVIAASSHQQVHAQQPQPPSMPSILSGMKPYGGNDRALLDLKNNIAKI